MPIEVELPGGHVVEFPDGMKPEQIQAVLIKQFNPKLARDRAEEEAASADPSTPWAFSRFTDYVMDPIGISDELRGIGKATKELVTGQRASETGQSRWDTAGEEYTRGAERGRAEKRIARQDAGPIADVAGFAAGLGMGGPARTAATAAVPWIRRAGQAAGIGASYGAASGFGQSEGGIGNRLAGTAYGAGLGAGVGAGLSTVVAPAAGALIRNAQYYGRSAGQVMRDTLGDVIPGMRRNVDARVARALERQGQTPQEALAAYEAGQQSARFGRGQAELPETIADIGPATQRLGRAATAFPGEASSQAEVFFGQRQRGQFARINDYLRRGLQVTRDNFARSQSRLVNEQRQLSKAAYDQAYATKAEFDVGDVLFNQQLAAFETAGPLARALNRARSLFIDRSRAPGYQAMNSIQRFDVGKRALDDMIESAMRAGRGNEARMLTQLKHELVAVADQATTVPGTSRSLYGEARDVYSSRAELLDALDAGRAFMKGDAEITAQQYRAMSTGERRMYRIGIAQQARRDLGRKKLGQDMVGYFDRPNVQDVLSEIMSPARYRQFQELMNRESNMARTNNIVRGGSPTSRIDEDKVDFNVAMRLGRVIRDKGLAGAFFDSIGGMIESATRMREIDAQRVAQLIFSTDPQVVRTTLNRLAQTYGRPRVRRAFNAAIQNAQMMLAVPAGAVAGRQEAFVER